MLDAFRRRRRIFLWTAAAGAAGTAAAYLGWQWWQEAQLLKAERSSVANLEVSDLLRVTSPQLEEFHAALDEEAASEAAEDLDTSMDSHFSYIQDISTPQELEQLLPRIQALLFEMTDISQLRSMQMPPAAAQQAAVHSAATAVSGSEGGSSGGEQLLSQQQQPGAPPNAADMLRRLAVLSFARSASACYLIPLVDLYVRVKLNLIGRHMFLQEKLVKLKQPVRLNGRVHVPPRLTAVAVETFLKCDHFAGQGSCWLIDKVMSVSAEVLSGCSMEATVGIPDLTQLLSRILSGVEAACTHSWPEILMGGGRSSSHGMETHSAMTGSADTYRRAMASSAMVEELQGELRQVLDSYRFKEALRAAVQHCFRAVAAQLHAGLLSSTVPASTAGSIAAGGGSSSATATSHSSAAVTGGEQPGLAFGAAGRDTAVQNRQSGSSGGGGASGRGVLPRLDEDAERCSGSSDGNNAAGASADDPSASSTQASASDPTLFSGFHPHTLSGGGACGTSANSAAGAADKDQELQPDPPDTPTASASQLLRERRRASTDGLNLGTHGKTSAPTRGLHGVGSASTTSMHLLPLSPGGRCMVALPLPALVVPPRPLARALRPVQSACDPLFKCPRSVTKGIAGLHPVTALCATAFACTPTQL